MNDFPGLSACQAAPDFGTLPRRAWEFFTDESRAARAGTIDELHAAGRRPWAGLLHPGAEVALARALSHAGSICVVSAMASCSIEEVTAAVSGPVWFQMYPWRDRGLVQEMLQRARAAGASVLVLTVDVPCSGNRDRDRRNGFSVPPWLTRRGIAGGLTHHGWSWRFVRRPPELGQPAWWPWAGPRRRRAPRPTGSSTRRRAGRTCAGFASGGAARW